AGRLDLDQCPEVCGARLEVLSNNTTESTFLASRERIDWIERAVLPVPNLVEDPVGDPADEGGRNVRSVEFGQVALDLPHRHAAGVEAQNLVVKAVEPCLALGDQLRLEAADPVARDRNRDLAILRQDRFRARPVAAVAATAARGIALLVTQVVRQLSAERARSRPS